MVTQRGRAASRTTCDSDDDDSDVDAFGELVFSQAAHLHRQVCASACEYARVCVSVRQRCSERETNTYTICMLPAKKFLSIAKSTRDTQPTTRHSQKIQQQHYKCRKKQRTQRNENINGELASANNYNIQHARKQM